MAGRPSWVAVRLLLIPLMISTFSACMSWTYGGVSYPSSAEALKAARIDMQRNVQNAPEFETSVAKSAIVFTPSLQSARRGVKITGNPNEEQINYVATVLFTGFYAMAESLRKSGLFESVQIRELNVRNPPTDMKEDYVIWLQLTNPYSASWMISPSGEIPTAIEIEISPVLSAPQRIEQFLMNVQRIVSHHEQQPGGNGSEISGGSASCFFISESGLLVTNNHVISHGKRFVITDWQGNESLAKLLKADTANDLALLKLNTATPPNHLVFAPFGSLRTGLEVFTIGYPATGILGVEPKYTNGVVSSTSGLKGAPNLFQMTAPLQPGNSGGPVLNQDGLVVGVATSTAAFLAFLKDTGSLPQNINWAIKGEYARILAELPLSEIDKALTREQAISHARSASCMITVF